MNEDAEDLKKNLKERISGPLAYITSSFIIYNWSWFYFVIFSEKSAEVKIASVIKFFPKLHGIGIPIAFGILLAIGMPFVRLMFKKITTLARKLEGIADHDEKNEINNYIVDKKIELANKNYELTTKSAAIEEVKKQREKLNKEISSLGNTLEAATFDHANINEQVNQLKKERHGLEMLIATNKIDVENYNNLKKNLEEKSKEIISLENELDGWKKILHPERSSIATLLRIIQNRPDWIEFMHPSEKEDMDYIANSIKYDHEKEKEIRGFLINNKF